jgi:hypothetical protein
MLGQSSIPAQSESTMSSATPETVPNPLVGAYLKATQTADEPKSPAPILAALKGVTSNTQTTFWKPFGYSVALAVVLGAMSLASRHMDALTGDKVLASGHELPESTTIPAHETPKPEPSGSAAQPLKAAHAGSHDPVGAAYPKHMATPPLDVPVHHPAKLKPLKSLVAKAKAKSAHKVAKKKAIVAKLHAKPRHKSLLVRKAAKPKAHARKVVAKKGHAKLLAKRTWHAHKATSPAIRVYDADGNPVR